MSRIVCIYGLYVVSFFATVASGQELRSTSEWQKEIDAVFTETADLTEFAEAAKKLLSDTSEPILWTFLQDSQSPALQLAACYQLSVTSDRHEAKSTVQLAVLTDSQYVLDDILDRIRTLQDSNRFLLNELDAMLSMPISETKRMNVVLCLKALSKQNLIELADMTDWSLMGSASATALMNEVFKSCSNWEETALKDKLLNGLRKIQFAPGEAQLTFVSNYPFESLTDALPHFKAALNSPSLATPAVILAVRKHLAFVLDHQGVLVNSEIAKSRLEELQARFGKE